jgi:hypothetical protein
MMWARRLIMHDVESETMMRDAESDGPMKIAVDTLVAVDPSLRDPSSWPTIYDEAVPQLYLPLPKNQEL